MTEYRQALKAITVTTTGGNTFDAVDTLENREASNALAEFEAFQTMHIGGDEVPFHAVVKIEVTTSVVDANRTDPYGCEESSGGEEVTLWSGEVAATWNDKAPYIDYSIIGIEYASAVKVGDTVAIELSDGTKVTNTVGNKYDNGTFDFGYPPTPGNFPSGMISKNDSWSGHVYIDKNGYTADTAPKIVKFSYIPS